jgi:radical SAM superfamily enzyme YgiQ (UPF0313 family)
MVPQGLLSIASYLLNQGHDVFVYDCLGPGIPFDLNEQVKAILDYKPQIVGFSATTSSFLDAAEITQKIKEHSRYITTACGGVHASALEGKLLSAFPSFYFLCAGEGELTMAEIAQDMDPAEIKV